jgi:hypothetical protein
MYVPDPLRRYSYYYAYDNNGYYAYEYQAVAGGGVYVRRVA